jgi:hypothetical protein
MSFPATATIDHLLIDTAPTEEEEASEINGVLLALRQLAGKLDLVLDAVGEIQTSLEIGMNKLRTGTSLGMSTIKRHLGRDKGKGSTVWSAIDMLREIMANFTSDVFVAKVSHAVLHSQDLKCYMLASKTAFANVVSRLTGLEARASMTVGAHAPSTEWPDVCKPTIGGRSLRASHCDVKGLCDPART